MANVDIRTKAKENGVLLWQIANALGITDTTFSRHLRYELPKEEKERIFTIIKKLAGK